MKYKIRKDLKINLSNFNNITLYRIQRCLTGELGGYVEYEGNLSQEGDCWVGGDAHVFENGRVSGNAHVMDRCMVFGCSEVYDNAIVRDDAQVLGCTKVYGSARVYGRAIITGCSEITGVVSSGVWSDKNCYGIDIWV